MSWLVFSYSLPSKGRSSPRVAVWRRLRALGAVSPKGGVHVLPARADCVEAFQWLAQEVEQARGEALLMRVERFEGLSDSQLVALFQQARRADYQALESRAAEAEKVLGGRPRKSQAGGRGDGQAEGRETLARLRREFDEIARVDFFDSPEGGRVAARLARIEEALSPAPAADPRVTAAPLEQYRNARWVTRPRPHVDRLACAWLIRRFINPRAVIRYGTAPEADEIGFDMPGARFGHQGNLCTFETMVRAFELRVDALRAIGEIVHEIDLRDGRYARPEIAGIDAVLRGWVVLPDAEREQHGVALFEGLYTALRRRSPPGESARGTAPRKRR